MKSSIKKKITIAALGISLSGAVVFAATRNLEGFRLISENPVNTPAAPAQADSTSEFKFKSSHILPKTMPASLQAQLQDYTTVANDSDGLMQFPEASRQGVLRSIATTVRAPRFANGTLKLRSNVPADIWFDGIKIASHATSDSLPGEATSQLTLQPEQTGLLQVNFLSQPGDKSAPAIGVTFEGDSLVTGESGKNRFSLAATTLGTRVSSASVSPDGKAAILHFTNTLDGKTNNTWSEVRDCASGKTLYYSQESLEWMPEGCTPWFTRTAVEGNGYDLMTVDLKSCVAQKKCAVANASLSWDPKERYIIYYQTENGKKDKGPLLRITEPDDRLAGARDSHYLVKQDLASGICTPITYGGPSTYLADISPDGEKVLYQATRRTPSRFPFYESCLVELDLNTLSTDTLTSGVGEEGFQSAIYSPDGRRLFICGGPESFDGIGRNAGSFKYANQFDGQGFIFDIASRKATAVTRDFNPAIVGEPIWNRADNKIYFRAEDGFYAPVFCYDPSKNSFTKLDTGIGFNRNFSVGLKESRWLVATGQAYDYAGRCTLLDLKTGKHTLLADPTAKTMAQMELGNAEPWRFTAADGTEVDGMMVLPPDFDSSKKYPLIVYYYGGTSPSSVGMSNPYTPHLFASRDYVVYVLNPSGTTGYGQEYSARHVNAWGDWTADEIIEGVKKFCAAHPFVNDKKIGCLGASYGGFMTQYLLTKTDIFAAAVSHAGISNVTSYWGEGWWGYSYNSVAAAKSYPWSNPDLFTKHGSLFNADKIHTPLLLLHGNADTNVPLGESIQLFNALSILGRQVELIEVDGQDHIITDYEKRKLWHAAIMAWFERFLKDDPAWWDNMVENL